MDDKALWTRFLILHNSNTPLLHYSTFKFATIDMNGTALVWKDNNLRREHAHRSLWY